MGINRISAVDATSLAVGREVKDLCEIIGIQPLYNPVQVGPCIESGDIQSGVDPTEDRKLAFALAIDSTFFWGGWGKEERHAD